MTTAPPALDVRRRPTFGVFLLMVAALGDLLLLPLRVVASLCCARRWRAQTRQLIASASLHPETPHAPQDPHPAR